MPLQLSWEYNKAQLMCVTSHLQTHQQLYSNLLSLHPNLYTSSRTLQHTNTEAPYSNRIQLPSKASFPSLVWLTQSY